jgi:hypothetical protein
MAEQDHCPYLKKLLAKYDRNGDGKLTKEDFQKVIEETGSSDHAQHLLDAFDAADVNKNGVLDADEVQKIFSAHRSHAHGHNH